ncbi:DUF421 domain-containing protein [Mucilaginibacter segetis]|uniref:DUF421 domain-containing protein n=1 Tax=Mucilaginibacter segetis TaxID=2793071 RepID=A0A934PT26_9SPHI|nr:YetF domain-containing protein [Mucilaginibacter segetis]MBK0379096.1 DUF421 domain-containing protein [Mucilaginibacter segetis]
MDIIGFFGEGKDLTILQMSARAIVIYFISLILIRISGRRTFGKKTSFDITIAIILGAVLSRVIVGVSPFWPTVMCSFALVLLHRGLAIFIIYNKTASKWVKGDKRLIYYDGQINERNLRKCLMTKEDLISDIRLSANTDNLGDVKEVFMEHTGKLSVVLKGKKNDADTI